MISAPDSLDMGKWHTVRLERSRRNGTMTVFSDNRRQVSSYNGFSPGRLQGLDLRSSLHMGGVSNFTSAVKRQVGVGQGFIGECYKNSDTIKHNNDMSEYLVTRYFLTDRKNHYYGNFVSRDL